MIRKLLFLLSLFLLCTWFAFAQAQQPNAQAFPNDSGPYRSAGYYVLPSTAIPQVAWGSVNPSQVGSVTYYYWVVTNQSGSYSIPAGPFKTAIAPVTLSASANVAVSWQSLGAGITYDLLRTTTSTPPTGSCNCAVATGILNTTQLDTSNSLSVYTVKVPLFPANYPVANDVAGFAANGQIIDLGTGSGSLPQACSGGSGSNPVDLRVDHVTNASGSGTGLAFTVAQTPSAANDFAMIFYTDLSGGPSGGGMVWTQGAWNQTPSGAGALYKQLSSTAVLNPSTTGNAAAPPWTDALVTFFTQSGTANLANSYYQSNAITISNYAITLTNATAIGNAIVVYAGERSNFSTVVNMTISDTQGIAFKKFSTSITSGSGNNVQMDLWIGTAVANSTDVITVSGYQNPSFPNNILGVEEISGLAPNGHTNPGGNLAYYSLTGQVGCDPYFLDAGTGVVSANNGGQMNLQAGSLLLPSCPVTNAANNLCMGSTDSLIHGYSNNADFIPQQIKINSAAISNTATPTFNTTAGSTGVTVSQSGGAISLTLTGTGFGPAGGGHSVGIVPDPGNTSHGTPYYLGDDNAWHTPTFGIAVSQYSNKNLAGNVSMLATTLTTIDSLTPTLPGSGGPFRLQVCYHYGISNGTGVLGEMYVTDGTNNWAVSSLLTNSNGGIYASCGWSPTTYANGAAPTITIKAENTGAQTIITTTSLTGQTSGFQIIAAPSN